MHEERNKERVGPQPQIREQMRLGTYLYHEKSILGWFGQPAST